MNFVKNALMWMLMLMLVLSFVSSATAIGVGESAVAAYENQRKQSEVRIYTSPDGQKYYVECEGQNYYWGDYAEDEINKWKGYGWSVYIIVNTGSGEYQLCGL